MLNAGDKLGLFEIIGMVGKGGMGEVYLARDTRLGRDVAIKVLPENFAKDEERLSRFEREARLLASLNHPNIATVHDFQNEDGNYFLVMEHIGGDTLGEYIEKNPVSSNAIIGLFTQMAEALDVAHKAGVVHRDLKPYNVKIHNGLLKVLDFGLAKDSMPQPEQASPDSPTIRMSPSPGLVTESGVILGTPMYMSPEQARGKELDERTDIWALGCCLYESLTGKTPFDGDTAADILGEVLQRDPDYTLIDKSTPKGLVDLLRSCLQKKPEDRPRSMGDVAESLKNLSTAGSSASGSPLVKIGVAAVILIVVGIAGAFIGGQGTEPSSDTISNTSTRDLQTEILLALDAGDTLSAFDLAVELDAQEPDNALLPTLWERMSHEYSISSEPSGAKVYYTDYHADDSEWVEVGTTPLEKRFPHRSFRLKFEAEGYATTELARSSVNMKHVIAGHNVHTRLMANDTEFKDMVHQRVENFAVPIAEFAPIDNMEIPDFLIDRLEVTNAQYKEFVDAGGYSNANWWEHPFRLEGKTISFEEAITKFTDTVGRPGPAGWELGDYPDGQGDYPVGGVSWYEAAAYAKFRGKTLPSVFHWSAALFMDREAFRPLAPDLSKSANINTGAVAPVGQFHNVGTSGAINMGGNQREWCFNDNGKGLRYPLGGSWEDQPYFLTQAVARSPWDRSLANGFRCAVYLDETQVDDALLASVVLPQYDFRAIKPVPDAVFDTLAEQGQVIETPFESAVEEKVTSNRNYDLEIITIAGVDNSRLRLDIFTPKTVEGPLSPVLFFPGMDAMLPTEIQLGIYGDFLAFVPKSGRVLIIPHYRGLWENSDGSTQDRLLTPATAPTLIREWTQDYGRALQYVQSREDMNNEQVAYMGLSLGTVIGNFIVPYTQESLSCAVFIAGGFSSPNQAMYAPRITVPTIMINGDADYIFPVEQKQLPMFEMLGTPPEHKYHVVFDGGHVPDNSDVAKAALTFLDVYHPVK